MAINGVGGQLSSMMVFFMYGSFHLELLEAAGDTLCPFKRTMLENCGSSSSTVVAAVAVVAAAAAGPS